MFETHLSQIALKMQNKTVLGKNNKKTDTKQKTGIVASGVDDFGTFDDDYVYGSYLI